MSPGRDSGGWVEVYFDPCPEKLHAHIGYGIDDPLDRICTAVRAYLIFFADHPEFVELIMQERAQFKDRKKPTYFVHREANVERWRELYRGLIAAGRVRVMPVDRITDVMSDLLYGTMFTNYFAGPRKPPATTLQPPQGGSSDGKLVPVPAGSPPPPDTRPPAVPPPSNF